jgi:16S rRNA (uracil1498-N3)-methyltransferase
LIRKRANISLKYYVKDSDILYVTNGHSLLFETEITLASDNKCTVKLIPLKKSPFKLPHLAVAPTKMNDRYEWFLKSNRNWDS